MWVVLFHIAMWAPGAHPHIPIISRGYIAVDFFFILSGFILARAHAWQFSKYHWANHLNFVLKRFLRLFPLHWAALATLVAVMAIQGTPLYWRGYIIDEALLVHRWGFSHSPHAVINGPDWSISTEWAANLLYPIFIWLIMGSRIKAGLAIVSAIGLLLYVVASNGWSLDFSFARSLIPLMRCFAEFALGVSVYRYRSYSAHWATDRILGTLLAIDLFLITMPSTDILVVATIPFLILGLSASNQRIAAVLASKPLHWLGTVSYSIYLIQYPVILLSLWFTSKITNMNVREFSFPFVVIFLILIVSHFTYRFIEVKARRVFGKFTETLRRNRTPTMAASP